MIFRVTHRTSYDYGETVDLAHHLLCLTPRDFAHQAVRHSQLQVAPAGNRMTTRRDHFGNAITYLTIDEPHDRFIVELDAEVEVRARPEAKLAESPPWETVRDALADDGFPSNVEPVEFAVPTAPTPALPELRGYAQRSFLAGRPILEAARDLTRRIHRDFTFDATATLISTPLADVLKHRRGVCQDFAHLQIAGLRALGLAARYVSGYIQTLDKDGKPRLVGGDASHAWVSVFSPDQIESNGGWVEFDPTNDLMVGEQHVVLAWGRDYSDVSPTRGVILGGGEHGVEVSVHLAPVPA